MRPVPVAFSAIALTAALAACSSDAQPEAAPSSRATSAVPVTTSYSPVPSVEVVSSLPATEIPTDTATSGMVVDFIDENRVTIELMVSSAAGVRDDAKDGEVDNDCTDLDLAAGDVATAITSSGLLGDSDPLIAALTEASSVYQNAALACDYPRQADFIVSNIRKGNAQIRIAEARAKKLGTNL